MPAEIRRRRARTDQGEHDGADVGRPVSAAPGPDGGVDLPAKSLEILHYSAALQHGDPVLGHGVKEKLGLGVLGLSNMGRL